MSKCLRAGELYSGTIEILKRSRPCTRFAWRDIAAASLRAEPAERRRDGRSGGDARV